MIYLILLGFSLFSCRSETHDISPNPRITDVTRVTYTGYFLAPKLSDNQTHILMTEPNFSAIWVLEIGGELKKIADEPYLGLNARWVQDHIYATTRSGNMLTFHRNGNMFIRKENQTQENGYEIKVYQDEEDRIHLIKSNEDLIISLGGDKFYTPELSPNNRFVVYNGLNTGIYIYEIETGITRYVGTGTHPTWLGDSRGILYEKTIDDGRNIISSEIYYYSLATHIEYPLTNTSELVEMFPYASTDGKKIVFASQGIVYIANLWIPEQL